MEQLLIVEDDLDLNRGLCRALKTDTRRISSCETLKQAREQLLCQIPDLILLDLNLPDGNGLDLLKELRSQHPRLPIILLTANDTDSDIVTGLEHGADDYITKPFSLAVLRARVNTQLRKAERPALIEIGPYVFDFSSLRFSAVGKPIELSKTEQKLLRLLVENRGSTLSRRVLLDRIWDEGGDFVDENALSVTIKRLRDKLGVDNPIRTVYGVGYRWEEVR